MPMRQTLAVAALLAILLTAAPAEAQLRADRPDGPAPVAVYGQETTPGFSLGRYFNAETFRVSHSYEMSYSGFGGQSIGLGVYTTSLRWQPNDRLAARADIGVAHSPFGTSALQQRLGFDEDTPARVFLRNAQIAYRPTENSLISLSVQRSPYGNYYSPYGYGAPFGGSSFSARYAPADHNDLFWRSPSR